MKSVKCREKYKSRLHAAGNNTLVTPASKFHYLPMLPLVQGTIFTYAIICKAILCYINSKNVTFLLTCEQWTNLTMMHIIINTADNLRTSTRSTRETVAAR